MAGDAGEGMGEVETEEGKANQHYQSNLHMRSLMYLAGVKVGLNGK